MPKKYREFRGLPIGSKLKLSMMGQGACNSKTKRPKNNYSSAEGNSSSDAPRGWKHCTRDRWRNGKIDSGNREFLFIKIKLEIRSTYIHDHEQLYN